MMPHTAYACVILLGLATAAPQMMAQHVASTDAEATRAGAYKAELNHTQVSFSISRLGFADFSGFFSGTSGALALAPADPSTSNVKVLIPMDSVLTASTKRDGEPKGDEWFGAARFPNATLNFPRITRTANATASTVGQFTRNSITRPVILGASFAAGAVNPPNKVPIIGFQATSVINPGNFGVMQYLPFTGDEAPLQMAGGVRKATPGYADGPITIALLRDPYYDNTVFEKG